MSILKMLEKINELEKVGLFLESKGHLERLACKRYIRRDNNTEAVKRAKKSIELTKQSQAYFSLCQRLKIFVEQVNVALEKRDKKSRYLLNIVDPVIDSVLRMNWGLIELYLDAFENEYKGEIKQAIEGIHIMTFMDAFKNVPQSEIQRFMEEVTHEAKEEEREFLFTKGRQLGEDEIKGLKKMTDKDEIVLKKKDGKNLSP